MVTTVMLHSLQWACEIFVKITAVERIPMPET
jgi:hypothetical protein